MIVLAALIGFGLGVLLTLGLVSRNLRKQTTRAEVENVELKARLRR